MKLQFKYIVIFQSELHIPLDEKSPSSQDEGFRTSPVKTEGRLPESLLKQLDQSAKPEDGSEEFEQSELRIPPSNDEGRWSGTGDRGGSRLHSNIEILQVTSTSVQVQFPGITGGNLMYIEERLFRNGGDGGGAAEASDVPWENAIILEGNEIFTLTGLKPSTPYRLRWQAPDKQYQDVMVSTKGTHSKISKNEL